MFSFLQFQKSIDNDGLLRNTGVCNWVYHPPFSIHVALANSVALLGSSMPSSTFIISHNLMIVFNEKILRAMIYIQQKFNKS